MVIIAREAKLKPGYKLTEVGVIPEEWDLKTFDEVMTGFTSGATPSRKYPEFYKGDIRWITSGELNYNIIMDTIERVSVEAISKTNLKLIPKGTFLIAITGMEAEGTRGSCGIVGAEATTNQHCMALYPTKELSTNYLFHYYVFRGKSLALQYCQGTKQQDYTGKIVKLLPILLPPTIKEQQAIAAALSDVDALLTSLDRLIAKKRDIKQATMQQLLTGKVRLPGFSRSLKPIHKHTEVGIIPEDWKVTKLGAVADVKTGPFGSTLHEKDYVNDGTPIITVEHLSEQGVIYENLPMVSDIDRKRLNAYSLLKGDIVFSRVGSVDRNSLIKEEENGWLFSGRLLRIRSKTSEVDSSFLSYYFHQEPTKQRIRSVAVGQTMASLNTQILKNIDITFPPIKAEQAAIATVLTDMDTEIVALEQKREKTRALKQGMMQELLTGRIRLV
ncbi:MAG TPA: restriction endonuclease subunit S [Ktedonobacteraceae bacterium]